MKSSIDKNKEEFLFFYNKRSFPSTLISPDSLIHKDLIYTESSEAPLLLNTPKPKYSNNYIIDDELDKKKKRTKPYSKESSWRDNNIDFFDDFKGRTETS